MSDFLFDFLALAIAAAATSVSVPASFFAVAFFTFSDVIGLGSGVTGRKGICGTEFGGYESKTKKSFGLHISVVILLLQVGHACCMNSIITIHYCAGK